MFKQHVVDFFKECYTMDYLVSDSLPCRDNFPLLSRDEMSNLLLVAFNKEIRRAVFDMAPLKAPDVDRFEEIIF